MKTSGVWATIAAVILLASPAAFAANVSGGILGAAGKPVAGIKVIAQSRTDTTTLTAVSGAKGEYQIEGLHSGNYQFTLDPESTGFRKGQPVAAFVSDNGLKLNWVVSPSADPIAYAQPADQVAGVDPFGLSLGEFIAVSALVVAGAGAVAVGGYAAAGGFSGNGHDGDGDNDGDLVDPVSSPSQ